jgi:osmotically-inducible protein OsmY
MGDKELRLDILEDLDLEPSIDAADIGVAVDGHVVTLTGHVRSFSDKVTVREIVEGIHGVRAIADEIEVRPIGAHITADDEIAKRIVNTLIWNSSVPEDKIRATVTKGWVTLEGNVDWHYQSTAAEQAVRRLVGVTGVNNRLKITPAVTPADVSERIHKALKRDAEVDASAIKVNVTGGRVTLEGQVRYLGERRAAARAAWSAPGVTEVIDHLTVA